MSLCMTCRSLGMKIMGGENTVSLRGEIAIEDMPSWLVIQDEMTRDEFRELAGDFGYSSGPSQWA